MGRMQERREPMEVRPHFVESYERLITTLLDTYPLDEAMSLAVGGAYDALGEAEADLLNRYGLLEHHFLIDIGCGSGRLSSAIGRRFPGLRYLGTDIDPRLLEYAAGKAPGNFQFLLHQQLSIPADDASVDFIAFFSVFTHLLHEESYTYLRDAKRALRPGGTVIVSFLETSHHWETFESMLLLVGTNQSPHLNMFIERPMRIEWARHLELELDLPEPSPGQSMAIFRRVQLPIDFEANIYLELHKDVADAGVDPIHHYLIQGHKEGRRYR